MVCIVKHNCGFGSSDYLVNGVGGARPGLIIQLLTWRQKKKLFKGKIAVRSDVHSDFCHKMVKRISKKSQLALINDLFFYQQTQFVMHNYATYRLKTSIE